jgi:transmembrane sensor
MNLIDYFLANPEFVRWVKNPDYELDTYWKNWMDANPESLESLKLAREIILGIQLNPSMVQKPAEGLKEEILANILRQSIAELPQQYQVTAYRPKDFWLNRVGQIYKIAAILALSLGLAWTLFLLNPQQENQLLAIEEIWLEKSAAPGEKLNITLPDGSRVWLNSGSMLSFPEQFNGQRNVKLSGEGFFDVQEDASRPFSVESSGVKTTALGTSFNIKSGKEAQVAVSLFTGKVKIEDLNANKLTELVPGQELIFESETQEWKTGSFDVAKTGVWKDGKFIFENAGLQDVVKTLENWYGVKITLTNAEKVKWKFSGEYQNQMLENVLKSMSYIESFDYKIQGKQVEFIF